MCVECIGRVCLLLKTCPFVSIYLFFSVQDVNNSKRVIRKRTKNKLIQD